MVVEVDAGTVDVEVNTRVLVVGDVADVRNGP